jgi:hypothetical protein
MTTTERNQLANMRAGMAYDKGKGVFMNIGVGEVEENIGMALAEAGEDSDYSDDEEIGNGNGNANANASADWDTSTNFARFNASISLGMFGESSGGISRIGGIGTGSAVLLETQMRNGKITLAPAKLHLQPTSTSPDSKSKTTLTDSSSPPAQAAVEVTTLHNTPPATFGALATTPTTSSSPASPFGPIPVPVGMDAYLSAKDEANDLGDIAPPPL